MTTPRSAAGPALGYHYQVQRALLELLDAPSDETAIAIESLDDLTLIDDERKTVSSVEQLKHSIAPGSLTDTSAQWWRALSVWMDRRRSAARRRRAPGSRQHSRRPV
jgi:hypothetical protein